VYRLVCIMRKARAAWVGVDRLYDPPVFTAAPRVTSHTKGQRSPPHGGDSSKGTTPGRGVP